MRTRSAVIVMVMSVLRTCIGNMHVKEPDLRVLTVWESLRIQLTCSLIPSLGGGCLETSFLVL